MALPVNFWRTDHVFNIFRSKPCQRLHRNGFCEWKLQCQYSHCLDWPRRPPAKSKYSPEVCQHVRIVQGSNGEAARVDSSCCAAGQRCKYAHTKEEVLYHPDVFKAILCKEHCGSRHGRGQIRGDKGTKCHRYYCPFAHGGGELHPSPYSSEELERLVEDALAFPSDTCCKVCSPIALPAAHTPSQEDTKRAQDALRQHCRSGLKTPPPPPPDREHSRNSSLNSTPKSPAQCDSYTSPEYQQQNPMPFPLPGGGGGLAQQLRVSDARNTSNCSMQAQTPQAGGYCQPCGDSSPHGSYSNGFGDCMTWMVPASMAGHEQYGSNYNWSGNPQDDHCYQQLRQTTPLTNRAPAFQPWGIRGMASAGYGTSPAAGQQVVQFTPVVGMAAPMSMQANGLQMVQIAVPAGGQSAEANGVDANGITAVDPGLSLGDGRSTPEPDPMEGSCGRTTPVCLIPVAANGNTNAGNAMQAVMVNGSAMWIQSAAAPQAAWSQQGFGHMPYVPPFPIMQPQHQPQQIQAMSPQPQQQQITDQHQHQGWPQQSVQQQQPTLKLNLSQSQICKSPESLSTATTGYGFDRTDSCNSSPRGADWTSSSNTCSSPWRPQRVPSKKGCRKLRNERVEKPEKGNDDLRAVERILEALEPPCLRREELHERLLQLGEHFSSSSTLADLVEQMQARPQQFHLQGPLVTLTKFAHLPEVKRAVEGASSNFSCQ